MAGKIKVIPGSGGWDVRDGNTNSMIKHFSSKEPAVRFAKSLSYTQNTKLIIHNSNGTIAASYDQCKI